MKYSVLLCGLLLMQAVGLSAKEQVRLSADDVTIGRTGDSVRVSFRLNVAGLGKDYVLKVTPLLRGKGGQETEPPKLNYGSRRAQIVEWREGGMKKTQAVAPAYNKAGEALLYTHTFPYAEWMEGATFCLEAQRAGCCSKEDIDRYRDEATLVVYFPVGSVQVLPEFENNRAQLDHLLSVLNKIAASKDSRIAGKRAQVLVDHIMSRTKLASSFFEVSNDQVAWRMLRRFVADSDMDSRQEVMNIIDTAPVWDAAKKAGRLGLLMKLNGGKPYRHMKQHFFPKLRNAGYIKVFYESQPDPELVSLNKAIDLLQAKQYAEVLDTLQGNTHFRADNLRGVCHMMNGDMEKARALFQKAVAAGDPEAPKNLKQLEELQGRSR